MLSGLRILVAEDWTPLARELRYQLRSAGADIVGPAGRLSEALKLAEQADLDVAVLDMDLHEESVAPVARLLKEHGTPFVLMSGFDEMEVPDDLADAPFLEKPLLFDELREEIRNLCA